MRNNGGFFAAEPLLRLSRRSLIGTTAAMAAGAVLPLAGCAPHTSDVGSGQQYRDILVDVSGLLIPRTETAGADALFVWAADIALNAIYVGMDNATYPMVQLIRDDLDTRVGGDYLDVPLERRYRALEAMDFQVYAAKAPLPELAVAWRKIKGLLLLGYYTSEAGASQELAYELVPGHFDPDVPVTSTTRAYSSDWFGVSLR